MYAFCVRSSAGQLSVRKQLRCQLASQEMGCAILRASSIGRPDVMLLAAAKRGY
jgi:hypothetical protein